MSNEPSHPSLLFLNLFLIRALFFYASGCIQARIHQWTAHELSLLFFILGKGKGKLLEEAGEETVAVEARFLLGRLD